LYVEAWSSWRASASSLREEGERVSRLKRGLGSRQAGGRERIMDTQELGVEGVTQTIVASDEFMFLWAMIALTCKPFCI